MSSLTVYWAPVFTDANGFNQNMMYADPVNVYQDLIHLKNPDSGWNSFFNCPSVRDRMQHSFVFKNNLKTSFSYNFSSHHGQAEQKEGVRIKVEKPSNYLGGANITLDLQWIFFSEEPVEILIHPPLYHPPTSLSSNGMYVGGKMNIGKWFRPFVSEIQMWKNSGEVDIKEEDPLFYVEVLTDKKVEMKRFTMSAELTEIMNSCSNSIHIYGKKIPLPKRYKRFVETKTNKIVAREIKKNLI